MSENVNEEILTGEAKESETLTSQCPSCGATMVYYPPEKCLICEHCNTKKAIDLTKYSAELDFANYFVDNVNSWGNETHVYRCNNCGAKEILNKNDIAKTCPFCGTSNIVETDDLAGLKPNAIVPFEIQPKTAIEKLKIWAKKKFFAPRQFKKSVKADEIKGTYSPAFTYDCDTTSSYVGRLGKYYYKTRTVNGKQVTTRETKYYTIQGTYDRAFDDILIQASNKISQNDLNKLQPFDTNASHEYSTEFLHGFSANQYNKDGLKCWGEARHVIDANVRSNILSQYTYDFVDYININTFCDNIKYKYILLPIYVGHYKFNNKDYNFFVNGKNGRVSGKTPLSWVRVGLVALLGVAAVVGLGFLFFHFL